MWECCAGGLRRMRALGLCRMCCSDAGRCFRLYHMCICLPASRCCRLPLPQWSACCTTPSWRRSRPRWHWEAPQHRRVSTVYRHDVLPCPALRTALPWQWHTSRQVEAMDMPSPLGTVSWQRARHTSPSVNVFHWLCLAFLACRLARQRPHRVLRRDGHLPPRPAARAAQPHLHSRGVCNLGCAVQWD